MKKKIIISIAVCVIGLFAGLVFSWFTPTELYYGTDMYVPQDRSAFLNLSYTSWDDRLLGSDNFRMYQVAYPYGAYFAMTEYLDISVPSAQHILFFCLFFFAGLSFFFLLTLLWGKPSDPSTLTIFLLGSILYMYNPYTGIMIYSFPYLWYIYVLLPAKISLILYGIRENRGVFFLIFSILFLFIFSTAAYSNPKYIVVDLIPILILIFSYYTWGQGKDRFKNILRFVIPLGILFVLISAFWLIPTSINIRENISEVRQAYESLGNSRESNFKLDSTENAFDAVRQFGYWAINGKVGDAPYLPWTDRINSKVGIILSLILILVCLIPFLYKEETDFIRKHKILFTLWVGSLIGMVGLGSFIGKINEVFIRNIPFFIDAFSNPFQFFGLYSMFGLILLLVSSMFILYTRKRKSHYDLFLFVGIMILFTVISVFLMTPFLKGDIIRRDQDMLRSATYEIPSHVSDLYNFIKKEQQVKDSRTLTLPYSPTNYASYIWDNGYYGLDLNSIYLGQNVSGPDSVIRKLVAALEKGDMTYFDTVAPLYGISHIILNHDANMDLYKELPNWYVGTNLSESMKFILTSAIVEPFKLFGDTFVFKVSDTVYIPKVYIPTKKISENDVGKRESFISVRNSQYIIEQGDPILPVGSSDAIVATFIKIRPDTYRATISFSNPEVFTFVLNTKYDSDWKLKVFDQKKVTHTVSETKHYLVNQYANAWIVDPAELCTKGQCLQNGGSTTVAVEVYFGGRDYLIQGYLITLITMGVLVCVVVYSICRRYIQNFFHI